jgi:hypothetical protein
MPSPEPASKAVSTAVANFDVHWAALPSPRATTRDTVRQVDEARLLIDAEIPGARGNDGMAVGVPQDQTAACAEAPDSRQMAGIPGTKPAVGRL